MRILSVQVNCRRYGRRATTIALIEHLGDIVACEPVSRHLRRTRPDAYIMWCLRAPYRELVEHNSSVDKVIIVGCLTEWIWLRNSRILGEIVDLHPRGRCCQCCDVPLKKNEGDPDLNIYNYYNFGSLLQALSRSAGLYDLELTAPRLYIPASTIKIVDGLNLPERFVVFHARSNEAVRDWSDEKWIALLELIRKEHEILTVEVGLAPAFRSGSPRYRSFCGQTSFLELGEVLRRATLFIGIDSGPAHLANAVGTPGVVLLGHYLSFRRYLPYSGGYAAGTLAKLIYADGPVANVPVNEVYAAVTSLMQPGHAAVRTPVNRTIEQSL
jgi:heptosyltransferase-3